MSRHSLNRAKCLVSYSARINSTTSNENSQSPMNREGDITSKMFQYCIHSRGINSEQERPM